MRLMTTLLRAGSMTKTGLKTRMALAALLGGCFCVFRFGLRPFNFGHAEWILGRGDSATSYLGWLFFRSEPWSFPLGKITSYFAPVGTSIPLTDSIPLLAIPLKSIAFLLPETFQYHGPWVLACYCLQGCFAYLLARSFSNKVRFQFLVVALILLVPTFLNRERHIALASHWVFLAAFWLYFRNLDRHRFVRVVGAWLLLLVIACNIHPYIAFMTLAISVPALIKNCFFDRVIKWYQLLIALLLNPVAMVLSWYVSGNFIFSKLVDYSGGAYARSALNLNALWNPLQNSSLLGPLPSLAAYKHEGFQYLGVGLLLALLCSLYILLRNPSRFKSGVKHIPLMVVMIGLTVFALGNKVAFNDTVIFSYSIPPELNPYLSMFRASGRFFWPVCYAIAAFIVAMFSFRASSRLFMGLLAVCLVVQVIDISPILNLQGMYSELKFNSRLRSPLWSPLLDQCDHIWTSPPFAKTTNFQMDFRDIGTLAASNGVSTSAGYVARASRAQMQPHSEALRLQLQSGHADPKAIYLLATSQFVPRFAELREKMYCTGIDGIPVCFARDSNIRVPFVYDLKGWELSKYLARVRDKTLVMVVTDGALSRSCAQVQAMLRQSGANIEQSGRQGCYLALFHDGTLISERAGSSRDISLEMGPGDQSGALVLKKSVSARFLDENGDDRVSIQIDGLEQIFNLRGINIVVLDENLDVVEIANFRRDRPDLGGAWTLVPMP